MTVSDEGRSSVGNRLLGFRFEMALLYAFRLHAEQKRKGGEIPYIGHLLGVTALVIEAGGDEDQAIAALLHDTIEDQGVTEQELATLFGDRVARIVQSVSDRAPDDEKRDKSNWKQRKQVYLDHLRHTTDKDTLLISLADKLHNARSIQLDKAREGEHVWDRFSQPRDQQLWYYRGLVDAFKVATDARLLAPAAVLLANELEAVVSQL